MGSTTEDGRTGDGSGHGSAIAKLIIDNLVQFAVFVVDESGTIVSWNPGVRTLLGYDENEFIGRDSNMLFGADDIASGLVERERTAARDGASVSLRRWHRRKDGSLVWGDGQLVALSDGGRSAGYAFVVRDETERKRLETDLAEASRQNDRFLAMVSHELRAPLTAILGWVRVLQDGGLTSDEVNAAISTIERNTLLQRRLVEELLDCARLVAGALSIERVPVDFRDIVAQEIESMRAIALDKDLRIEVDITLDPVVINADPDCMRQIVDNILSNAIKFTLDAGTITTRLERDGSHAQLTVNDTGVGIDPEFLPFLFERFRQATTTRPLSASGVGLGLCIARELIELHGGTISAASEGIGRGATFTVRIPLA